MGRRKCFFEMTNLQSIKGSELEKYKKKEGVFRGSEITEIDRQNNIWGITQNSVCTVIILL